MLPTDTKDYARTLWFDAYAGGTIFRHVVHPLFHQTVVNPNIRKEPTDRGVVDDVFNNVQPKIFGYLEGEIDGKYLVGDALTLADIAITSNFIVYQYLGFRIDPGPLSEAVEIFARDRRARCLPARAGRREAFCGADGIGSFLSELSRRIDDAEKRHGRRRKTFEPESNAARILRHDSAEVADWSARDRDNDGSRDGVCWRVAASGLALAGLGNIASPYLSFAASRPLLTHGLQSGDVTADSGVVWARADRPSRLLIEASTTRTASSDICCTTFADALPESDFTAKVLLEDLPAGQQIFYRVTPHDLASPSTCGEAQYGRFRTAPDDTRPVSFVWSGDTAGQGWGIDEARGGMRAFRTMLDNRPDFFIHSGDSIYADCPIPRELKLPGGGSLAQSGDGREVGGGAVAGAVPRQLQIQSARRQRPRLQRRGADSRAVGRSRGRQRLVARAAPSTRRAIPIAARCSSPRAPSRAFHEYMPTRQTLRRTGPRLPQDRLWPAARRVPDRHAQLPRAERRAIRRGAAARREANRLAEARARRLEGDLEGDRRRHADRARQPRMRSPAATARRRAARTRSPACCHSSSAAA